MNRHIILIALLLLVISISGCIDNEPVDETGNATMMWIQDHNVTNVSAWIEQDISRTDEMGAFLENELQRLQDEGEDVEDLEMKINRFNDYVESARQTKEMADQARRNSPETAQQHYFESAKDMYRSHLVIKSIIRDSRIALPGQVTLENGNISIHNDGYTSLSGDLDIRMTARDATVALVDPRNNAVIDLNATYTTAEKDQMKANVYEQFSGNMNLSGSGLTVLITGDNLTIDAAGTGMILMKGNGTYIIRDVTYQIPDMIFPPPPGTTGGEQQHQGSQGPQTMQGKSK